MIWLKVAGNIASWSTWLWQQREALGPLLQRTGDLGDFAQAALADPNGALRRVGGSLVFGSPDGGQKVLAFVEETPAKLDGIQQAVDGLGAGQAAMSATLGSLQTISMLTLGVSALTHVVLAAQFLALRGRLSRVETTLADLSKKIDAMNEAHLKAGLEFLKFGEDFLRRKEENNAGTRFNSALEECIRSLEFYNTLLDNELSSKKPRLQGVQLLSRHFSVALMATVSCQLGLGQDVHALDHIQGKLPLLQRATAWQVGQTVANRPVRFLAPELGSQVSLRLLAEFFRQAKDAGAVETEFPTSEAELFEQLRPELYRGIGRDSFKFPGAWMKGMLAEMRQAMASVEETNRVIGLKHFINENQKAGLKSADVMDEVRCRISDEDADSTFVVWANEPSQKT